MENPLFLFNHYNILTYSNIGLYTLTFKIPDSSIQDSRLSHSRFKIPAFQIPDSSIQDS